VSELRISKYSGNRRYHSQVGLLQELGLEKCAATTATVDCRTNVRLPPSFSFLIVIGSGRPWSSFFSIS
jgi:hypothetical protein